MDTTSIIIYVVIAVFVLGVIYYAVKSLSGEDTSTGGVVDRVKGWFGKKEKTEKPKTT